MAVTESVTRRVKLYVPAVIVSGTIIEGIPVLELSLTPIAQDNEKT